MPIKYFGHNENKAHNFKQYIENSIFKYKRNSVHRTVKIQQDNMGYYVIWE